MQNSADHIMPPSMGLALRLACVVLLGVLIYSGTLSAPFQWDELDFITQNPAVKNMKYMGSLELLDGTKHYKALRSRYLGFLSFALNHRFNAESPAGYHIVNIALHVLSALVFYAFVSLVMATPALRGSDMAALGWRAPFLASLLFVSHPIQTEAVTYIFQRFVSMSALFYMLSLTLYLAARLNTSGPSSRRIAAYAASVLAALLAMKSKENAITLPLAIMLAEWAFFLEAPISRKRVLALLPYLAAALVVPLSLMGSAEGSSVMRRALGVAHGATSHFSRHDYFLTEMRVILTYVRLFIFPVSQNIDYDYATLTRASDMRALLPMLLHALAIGGAAFGLLRSGRAGVRLACFGVLWMYLTLSVESSVIPIPMLINEYRMYLPSMGLLTGALALAPSLEGLASRFGWREPLLYAVLPGVLMLSVLTVSRNALWKDEISLWLDTAAKSPMRARVLGNLARAYQAEGMHKEAVFWYMKTLAIDPAHVVAHLGLGKSYDALGMKDKAGTHIAIARQIAPGDARAYIESASLAMQDGDYAEAARQLKQAVAANPSMAGAHLNLALALMKLGMADDAFASAIKARGLDPRLGETYRLIGDIYRSRGSDDLSISEYAEGVRNDPENAALHASLGAALGPRGRLGEAIEHLLTADRLSPGNTRVLLDLGTAYYAARKFDSACSVLQRVIEKEPDNYFAHYNISLAYRALGRMADSAKHAAIAGRLGKK